MRTIRDEVMDNAKELKTRGSSTSVGMEMLHLEHNPEHFAAGNIYLQALTIINELTEKLAGVTK